MGVLLHWQNQLAKLACNSSLGVFYG